MLESSIGIPFRSHQGDRFQVDRAQRVVGVVGGEHTVPVAAVIVVITVVPVLSELALVPGLPMLPELPVVPPPPVVAAAPAVGRSPRSGAHGRGRVSRFDRPVVLVVVLASVVPFVLWLDGAGSPAVDEESPGTAVASPDPLASAAPTPSATAREPTRQM